jgi:hypothetical protein
MLRAAWRSAGNAPHRNLCQYLALTLTPFPFPIDFTDPMGLEDIRVSQDLDILGAKASLNSLRAALAAGDHKARSQLIQQAFDRRGQPFGKPVLQTDSRGKDVFNRGERVTQTRRNSDGTLARTGAATSTRELETGRSDEGTRAIGKGHVHLDVTGKDISKFSDIDYKAATEGKIIYKVNESNPSQVLRLTPQTNLNDAPTVKPVDPKLIENLIKGTKDKLQDVGNAENGFNPKPR